LNQQVVILRTFFVEPLVMLATVLQWVVLSTITGVLVGTGVSFFLIALFASTEFTADISLWLQMLVLPLGGLANGLLLYYGYRLNRTGLSDRVITAVHDQRGLMPLKTLWIKPLAGIITLASGGSAGKEGPCSHLGANLASGLGQALKVNSELRKRLVACGVSAGFASVFGTPIAGAIYGVEVLAVGRIRHDFLLPAIIGGVTAHQVSLFWGVPYDNYHIPFIDGFSQLVFIKTIMLGIACGLIARFYVDAVHFVRKLFEKFRDAFNVWPPLLPFIGGCIIAILILWIPTDYLGLSLPLMDSALEGNAVHWTGFIWKTLLVAITLGSGFYAGVVTPQFVIGAVAGNMLAYYLGISPALGAAIGLVAVLASASNTPIAAILMGVELFGGTGLLYVAGASISAYLLIGHRSIYPDQRLAYAKSSWIHLQSELPIGQEKVRLSYGLLKWWSQRKKRK
jgi:H+/Cl- antiporter ClcA